jgi:short-subunit dehydrogenase
MKKVIIIGATSGIGRELALLYAGLGCLVGVTGRRQELLYSLQLEYPNTVLTRCFDVRAADALSQLRALVGLMEGMDLFIYNAGYGEISRKLDGDIDLRTVETNVSGFIRLVDFAYNFFERQGSGQLAAISSVAALRGSDQAPAYSASKAFISNYLEGLSLKARKAKLQLRVTDIRPGFVDTKMAEVPERFWVAPVQKAARQIHRALEKKKAVAYVTRRWALIGWMLKWIPGSLYRRIA